MAMGCETQWSLPHDVYGLQAFPKKQTHRFGSKPRDLDQKKAPRKCQEYIDAYSMEALAADDFGQKAAETWTMGDRIVKGTNLEGTHFHFHCCGGKGNLSERQLTSQE